MFLEKKDAENLDYVKLLFDYNMSQIDRNGIDDLVDFLKKDTNFLESPASTKFHLACKGGLLIHSANVYLNFNFKNNRLGNPLSDDSVRICPWFHDLCKYGRYELDEDTGFYKIDPLTFGPEHAKLSIKRIEAFIDLTDEERNIIKYHMGTFYVVGRARTPEYTIDDMTNAIQKHKMVQVFASSDMECSMYEDKFLKHLR